MRIGRFPLRSINDVVSSRFALVPASRALSTSARLSGYGMNNRSENPNSYEREDEFEQIIFGDDGFGNGSESTKSFFRKLDKARRDQASYVTGGYSKSALNGLGEGLVDGYGTYVDDTLADGMDGKLKRATTEFQYDSEEVEQEGYNFRPDMNFPPGSTYEDLDLARSGVWKPTKRAEFETTTEVVLRKADFRNVRFLAKFLTEAGIIIKRSHTGISAKAQRKVAREIKAARAFGLMPFTTMGTKSFTFGRTMEALDEDYEYETYDNRIPADFNEKAL